MSVDYSDLWMKDIHPASVIQPPSASDTQTSYQCNVVCNHNRHLRKCCCSACHLCSFRYEFPRRYSLGANGLKAKSIATCPEICQKYWRSTAESRLCLPSFSVSEPGSDVNCVLCCLLVTGSPPPRGGKIAGGGRLQGGGEGRFHDAVTHYLQPKYTLHHMSGFFYDGGHLLGRSICSQKNISLGQTFCCTCHLAPKA